MGNLIEKDDQGNWGIKGLLWENLHEGRTITKEVFEKLYGCLWKLMEYESTDLEPEQLFEIDRMYRERCEEVKNLKERDEAKRIAVTVEYSCAQCGYSLCYDKKENFCPRCGQRLYWPDINKSTLIMGEDGLRIQTENVDTAGGGSV